MIQAAMPAPVRAALLLLAAAASLLGTTSCGGFGFQTSNDIAHCHRLHIPIVSNPSLDV